MKIRRSLLSSLKPIFRKFMELCQMRLNNFEWIKHLYLSCFEIAADEADSIAYILNQLETLKLCEIVIDGDFYETILVHCNQLKYLGVKTTRG